MTSFDTILESDIHKRYDYVQQLMRDKDDMKLMRDLYHEYYLRDNWKRRERKKHWIYGIPDWGGNYFMLLYIAKRFSQKHLHVFSFVLYLTKAT